MKEISNDIKKLLDGMNNAANDIQHEFYLHERYFDNKPYAEHLGLDNVNLGVYCSLPWAASKHTSVLDDKQVKDDFKTDYIYFSALKYCMECEGYGMYAAARGFDVCKPEGIMWTKSRIILRGLDKIATEFGFSTKGLVDEGIKLARHAR